MRLYELSLREGKLNHAPLFAEIARERRHGRNTAAIAHAFHEAVASADVGVHELLGRKKRLVACGGRVRLPASRRAGYWQADGVRSR